MYVSNNEPFYTLFPLRLGNKILLFLKELVMDSYQSKNVLYRKCYGWKAIVHLMQIAKFIVSVIQMEIVKNLTRSDGVNVLYSVLTSRVTGFDIWKLIIGSFCLHDKICATKGKCTIEKFVCFFYCHPAWQIIPASQNIEFYFYQHICFIYAAFCVVNVVNI